MIYKIILNTISKEPCAILRNNEDGTVSSFLFDPANTDYQAYLKWLEEGNVPLAAETNTPSPAENT